MPFARDDRIVFDRAAWAHALAPYPDPQAPAAKTVGWGLGERYFDLALTLPDGRRASVGALKGKLVVLQFWGSWCPPCRVEMPDFEKLYDKFKDSPDIVFLLVNYREEGAVGRRWAARQEVRLPLADSGRRGREVLVPDAEDRPEVFKPHVKALIAEALERTSPGAPPVERPPHLAPRLVAYLRSIFRRVA